MAITVISGPACSGKTTLARSLARPGVDVLIDFDDLARSFGSDVQHGHAEQFVAVTQRARGVAIRAAMDLANLPDVDVYIIDSSVPDSRMALYRRHGARIHIMDTPLDECHRRADATGRPALWHQLIDQWTPTAPVWEPPKRWRPRPAYRKPAATRRFQVMRAHFLADKTNCDNCGQPFITTAPCTHGPCLRRGKGCHFHPQYPTIQHTQYLADGGPALDPATWLAWCSGCNTSDGAHYRNTRAHGHTSAPTRAHGRGHQPTPYTNQAW